MIITNVESFNDIFFAKMQKEFAQHVFQRTVLRMNEQKKKTRETIVSI